MNKMKHLKPVAAAVAAMLLAGMSHAGETVQFENGVNLDWRLTTNYTLSQRLKNPDPEISTAAAAAGSNDGNNNFAKNALTNNRVSALFEGKVYKGDSGFVLSGSTFYDDVYHRSNDNTTSSVNKPSPYNEFTDDAVKYHGGYTRLLDAYGYTSFDVGDSSRATIRAGRHAVNWGEATFFPNIAMAQGPFDGTKTGVPGTETKDSILPEDQISGSIAVTPRLSLLGQAQFNFHETIVAAPGSYMSSSDAVGPGASCLRPYMKIPNVGEICSFGTRRDDIRPSKTGQWGLGARYRVTDETEAGVYYLNYNDRSPMVVTTMTSQTTGYYNIKYFDNVKMLGATASTTFGPVSAYAELTNRQGTPILVGPLAAPTRADATMLNLGGMWNVGRTPIADSITVLGEVMTAKYSNYGTTEDKLTFKTDNGTAISTTVVLSYPGIAEGWDLSIPINYAEQLNGRTLFGGYGEGDKRYSVGATFTRRGNLSVGVSYNGFLGSASRDMKENRLLADRNYLSATMKYSF